MERYTQSDQGPGSNFFFLSLLKHCWKTCITVSMKHFRGENGEAVNSRHKPGATEPNGVSDFKMVGIRDWDVVESRYFYLLYSVRLIYMVASVFVAHSCATCNVPLSSLCRVEQRAL